MPPEEIKEKTRSVMIEVFELDAQNLPNKLDMDHLARWDSLGHLALISKLSKEFGIEIYQTEAIEMLSEEDIIKIIEKNTAG